MENNQTENNQAENNQEEASQEKEGSRFLIPVEGVLQEVDEKTYREIYQPIWKKRKQMERDGECLCPKEVLWLCDGVCPGCPYYSPKKTISLESIIMDDPDDPIELQDTITDFSHMPEFLVLENELIDAIHEAIYELKPEDRRLCILMMRCSERKAASIMGITRDAVRYRWESIKKELKAYLKENYL